MLSCPQHYVFFGVRIQLCLVPGRCGSDDLLIALVLLLSLERTDLSLERADARPLRILRCSMAVTMAVTVVVFQRPHKLWACANDPLREDPQSYEI